MKTSFEKKSKLMIKDFFFFKLVKILSEEEEVLARKFCFNCEVFEKIIVVGNWLMFFDGRCFKIKQKCGSSGMIIVVEHRESLAENGEDKGNISYFRVFNYDGSEVFAKKRYSTRFSDMETDIFYEDLIFKGDYFEFKTETGYGVLALDGRVLILPEYEIIYQECDWLSDGDVLCCYTGETVDGEEEYHVYSLLGKRLID